jgi:hypothetical protein
MAGGTYSRDEPGAEVDAVGNRKAESGLDAARTGENPVDPAFELDGLFIDLGAADRHPENAEHDREQPKA